MNRMETCFESEVTRCGVAEYSRRMSPISRIIDRAEAWRWGLVIVLGAVDNTMGVSVLSVSPSAGGAL